MKLQGVIFQGFFRRTGKGFCYLGHFLGKYKGFMGRGMGAVLLKNDYNLTAKGLTGTWATIFFKAPLRKGGCFQKGNGVFAGAGSTINKRK